MFVKVYSDVGVDELVFYEISVSVEKCLFDVNWVENIVCYIDILFCVVGGIKFVVDVVCVLECGVDKISINSFVIVCFEFIKELYDEFGK